MLYYTAIALLHRVAFGTELLDALEFGGPSEQVLWSQPATGLEPALNWLLRSFLMRRSESARALSRRLGSSPLTLSLLPT